MNIKNDEYTDVSFDIVHSGPKSRKTGQNVKKCFDLHKNWYIGYSTRYIIL